MIMGWKWSETNPKQIFLFPGFSSNYQNNPVLLNHCSMSTSKYFVKVKGKKLQKEFPNFRSYLRVDVIELVNSSSIRETRTGFLDSQFLFD